MILQFVGILVIGGIVGATLVRVCQWLNRKQTVQPTEYQRRIYYQNIVYDVCTVLDQYANRKICCGTVEHPSQDVQDTLRKVLRKA